MAITSKVVDNATRPSRNVKSDCVPVVIFLWCYDDAYDEENDDAIDDDSNDNDNVMIKLKIDGGEECKLKNNLK